MKHRILLGFAVLALATLSLTTAATAQASTAASVRVKTAAVAVSKIRAQGNGSPNLSATVSPSWQTNNTVWALAVANGVVYVGGAFTSVRPPGDPLGTGEVPRSYLAAFDESGDLLSFDPTLNGAVRALAVSPDGTTLYAGGSFTQVDGVNAGYLAAFSTSTGALLSTWAPTATSTVLAIAVAPNGGSVYIGGDFWKLDGQVHPWAGAVGTSGNLLPWAPNLNDTVTSIAVAPDDSRVLLGGYFSTLNGVTDQAIGSVDPTTGTSDPWATATLEPNYPGCLADVKDVIISGTTAYVASEGTGGGCFDGDFAANVSTGTLIWQNDCLGATQALAVVGNWLYKGSHAHDCAYAPGGFPQVPDAGGWVTHYLLDQSLVDGSLGHWNPITNAPGGVEPFGVGTMATDGTNLFIGGDFTIVNGLAQQGFAEFAPGPLTMGPTRPAAPTVTSTSVGIDSVTFSAVSDPDVGTLTYAIYRDNGTSPIATMTATSWPWALPVLHYRDAGLAPGSKHTYTVTASDGTLTTPLSPPSTPVTVATTSPPYGYEQTVLNDGPSFLWLLNETSGTTAYDSSPNAFNGIYEPGTTQGLPGSTTGNPDTATGFNGAETGLVTSVNPVNDPQTFSIEGWFETTTNTGGDLISFGNAQTGLSSDYDRNVYMMNDGQVVFGVYNSGVQTIESKNVFNDGQWHYVVATLSPSAGMALYIDGQLIGTNPTTSAQAYGGYWRVGGDNLNGWNLDYWGSNSQRTTEPNSFYWNGTIDDVAVYPYAISAVQVATHYAANALSH
jgi:hypothetical protein